MRARERESGRRFRRIRHTRGFHALDEHDALVVPELGYVRSRLKRSTPVARSPSDRAVASVLREPLVLDDTVARPPAKCLQRRNPGGASRTGNARPASPRLDGCAPRLVPRFWRSLAFESRRATLLRFMVSRLTCSDKSMQQRPSGRKTRPSCRACTARGRDQRPLGRAPQFTSIRSLVPTHRSFR